MTEREGTIWTIRTGFVTPNGRIWNRCRKCRCLTENMPLDDWGALCNTCQFDNRDLPYHGTHEPSANPALDA